MTETEFDIFKLLKPIRKAIAAEQYRTPTPIQAQAIPKIMVGRDVVGVAQTGTGKTAAFALPILHSLGKKRQRQVPSAPRVLVLAPTRELAAQISEQFETYGKHMNIRLTTVYGGVSQQPQVRALKKGVQILVATPGRLLDLLEQEQVDLDRLEVFVLDEADRMLDMGFLPDLRKIIPHLPDRRQSLFFSATMPGEIQELVESLLHKPVRIDVTPADAISSTIETIDQRVMFVEFRKKPALVTHILKRRETGSVLVFTRTKHGARRLSKLLKEREINADALHGDRTQNARTRILKEFRKGNITVLVATDVAARGIDVNRITHVINYDLPNEPDVYVHRIGRTGRAGVEGMALSFCQHEDLDNLRAIEQVTQRKLEVDANHPYHVPGLENRYASGPDVESDADVEDGTV